jgi:hypothetical protein
MARDAGASHAPWARPLRRTGGFKTWARTFSRRHGCCPFAPICDFLKPALNLEPLAARAAATIVITETSCEARASPLLFSAGLVSTQAVLCKDASPGNPGLQNDEPCERAGHLATAPRSALGDDGGSTRIIRSQMKHADALTLKARHCLPFVVAVQRLYDRYMVSSRVMRAYGQNRGASDGDK